jgi:two-component system, NtrC family, sensor kinase
LCGLPGDRPAHLLPHDLVSPEGHAALDAATAQCLRGGDPPAQTLCLRSHGGSQRPVELTLRRVTACGGPALLATCTDLSDFQHVQGMLLTMDSLLRQMVDGAPVAVYMLDHDHRVTHWNLACERLTGCTAESMRGRQAHWRAFHDRPQRQLADLIVDGIDPLAAPLDLGGPVQASSLVAGAYELERCVATPRLGERWLHFTVAPLRDAQGNTTGAIVTMQDVTSHRRAEDELARRIDSLVAERSAELAAQARVMDAFIDNAPFGVVHAASGRVLRSNRRMREIFGPATGADAGERDFHLDTDDLARLSRLSAPRLLRGRPVHRELWLRHASGRPIWAQLNAFRVDPADRHSATWWMVQDRTEVKAAQQQLHSRFEELQATNRMLEQAQNQLLQQDKMASIGQLAAGVAHEINNPVGFVSSNLHTLRHYVASLMALVDAQARAGAAPDDAAAAAELARVLRLMALDDLKADLPQLLDESAEGLARVKKIVRDLKDFSRVDQADWQQVDLNAGLASTLNVVRNELKYKCEVVQHLQPLPLVTCLAGQLNQVFMNLILNASQAIDGHGTVTLSSGTQDDWVWVQVDDTGCGMTEDVRRRIFEPFFTTKPVGKGTGLGLSLSFAIVQRHGGQLQVRSAPGQGSAFRVWVPVQRPAPGADGQASAPPAWV